MKKECANRDDAVSPVVGVMMMLVVTIIIAAVVSGFAGGLASGEQKAPQVSIETHIVNSGLYSTSGFTMEVKSVSEPVSTGDLKLITSWVSRDGTHGGASVMPNSGGVQWSYYTGRTTPFGFGPGVENWGTYASMGESMCWGNFTLQAGTICRAYPAGPYGPGGATAAGGYGVISPTYEYVDGTSYNYATNVDFIQPVLGQNWNLTRPGDIVNVKILHIPSGKFIYNADIAVEGSGI